MLIVGLVVLVAVVGLVTIGLLCLGLWRRTVALGREVASVGERVAEAQTALAQASAGRTTGLEHDLAVLRAKHPGVHVEVRSAPGR